MKYINGRKPLYAIIVPPLLGLIALGTVAQNDNDQSKAIRELKIMTNIFEAALEQDENSEGFQPISSPDALYLANQGMVFTFNMRNNFSGWGNGYWREFGRNMASLGSELTAELSSNYPGLATNLQEIQDELQTELGLASPQAFDKQQEAIREMNDAMRDTQESIQDMQRDIRNAQRAIQNGENVAENQARADELQANIDAAREELDQQSRAYQNQIAEYEANRQQQMEVRTEAFSTRIFNILCEYGSTLNSLRNNEYITVILEEFTEDHDQVYVMSYEDVANCTAVDALREQANGYQL